MPEENDGSEDLVETAGEAEELDGKAEAGASEPEAIEAGQPGSRQPAVSTQDVGVLGDIELEATLQFGSADMPLADLLGLGPGDVVALNRHVSEPVDLVVGDRIVARGEVVIASGNFALRITEVATPQLRLESIRCLF